VAVTITVAGSGTVAGAVYFPVASMVPQLAPEQPDPETLQTTSWLTPFGLLPIGRDSFALNCCTALIGTVGLGDKMVTATDNVDGLLGMEALLPPHPGRTATPETPKRMSKVIPRCWRFI
jgi:hypothetical protein